jgi:hypothetical protein
MDLQHDARAYDGAPVLAILWCVNLIYTSCYVSQFT